MRTIPPGRRALGFRQTGENGQAALPVPVAAETEADFDAKVAAITGQSLRSVALTERIANAFPTEQLKVLAQMEVNQTDMVQISKIKDETLRAEVVNLIASGMVVADAIKEVCNHLKPARETGKPRAQAGSKVKSRANAR